MRIEDRGWQSALETHAILDLLSSILKKSPFHPLSLSVSAGHTCP